MNVAQVIGNIWATRKNKNIEEEKILIIQPLDPVSLRPKGRPLAAIDSVRAGKGDMVYYVTAREATFPLHKTFAPVDATIVGIIDRLDIYSNPHDFQKETPDLDL
jgi:ethanolamine utilization protein EutN